MIVDFLRNTSLIFIHQKKEWGEIIFNFEFRNKYTLLNEKGEEIGKIEEKGSGFLIFFKRLLFRSHRPFDIDVYNSNGQLLMNLSRPFFFFFSSIEITDDKKNILGHVHRKFAFFSKVYEILDNKGALKARISSPILKIWTFPILNERGEEIAVISKKWGGILKEYFSDADRFGIQFNNVEEEVKPLLMGAAISIDFDFFEQNQGNQ